MSTDKGDYDKLLPSAGLIVCPPRTHVSMTSNFYPVQFSFDTFQIGRLPYSQESFNRLRGEFNSSNSFFRRDGHTYVSQMGEHQVPNRQFINKSIKYNRDIVGSLVRHIFFRTFRDQHSDIVPLTFSPFRIMSRKREHDLLGLALRNLRIGQGRLGDRLARKKVIAVEFREIVQSGIPVLGALISVRYSWTFGSDVSCSSLLADGLDLVGREVLLVEPIPGLDGVLAPDENLIGVISSVSDGKATVETNNGAETHSLTELLPLRSRKNINDILAHYLGSHRVDSVHRAVKELDIPRLNAQAYHREVTQMAATVAKLEFVNRDGFSFRISNRPFEPADAFRLEDPKFRFDYGPGASSSNASYGLLQHGPFDSLMFAPKTPRVAILCHGSVRDAFTSFLGKLRDGIPEATNFRGGMRGKYRLQDIAFDAGRDFMQVETFSGDEYERLAAQYLSENGGDQRADLVLIQTKDEFKTYASGHNPYYRAKARFMMSGVPTQFLKTETIRQNDRSLQYTIDSVALQIYAKMGGVPYVLPAGNNVDREIVVGIGHAVTRSNAFQGNDQDRVVGITTFFKADGEYLFGTRCREVPYDEYFQALLENLRASLDEVSSDYGWREGDAVRLVFHMFKPIKNIEADVIARLVSEYPQYAITFAFVTVSDRHPFVIFDPKERGKQKGQVGLGAFVPRRRTNWALDDRSCLIQLTGAQEMSTALHGFSTPVLVRVHESSTYTDLHAIAQQVFNFTFLSWRSFKPSRIPVTIDYANQISRKLTNLRKVKGWLPETVNAPEMRRKKWFL